MLSSYIFASSNTDFFRTRQSGSWNNVNSWESSIDNVIWQTADLIPTSSSRGITIRENHTITTDVNLTIDDVFVLSGGQLNVNSNVIIANGSAANDFTVSGIVENSGSISPTGRLVFNSGGVYKHTHTTIGGSIPFATWNNGSECQIIGFTTNSSHILLSGSNNNFYDFTWNCPNQQINSAPTLSHSINVRNNFSVISTGLGVFRMIVSSANVITRTKNYIQSGGIMSIMTTNEVVKLSQLYVSGNFIMTGGVLSKGSGSGGRGKLIFTGPGEQLYQNSGGLLEGNIEVEVNSGAILNFSNNILPTYSGSFFAASGSTLITSNPQGFAASGAIGSIQNSGVRIFSDGTNYVYNGNVLQQTGTGLPSIVNNLTINNPAGVELRSGSLTVTNILNLQTGFFDLGTNPLISNGTFGSTGNGTLLTQNTSATPLSANKTWSGTVQYNSLDSQSIVGGNYNNLNSSGGVRILPSILNIAGVFTPGITSNYNTDNTTIVFNGAGAQLIPEFNYFNLTASTGGTKTVSGASSVSNTLTVNSPAVLNANGNLTLLATATNNANLVALSGSADVTGNVNVQVYLYGVPSGRIRGTKTMSSPINDNLIAGAKTFAQLKNYIPITGPGNTANGFDLGGTGDLNAVTLNFYNEPAAPTVSAFTPVPALATALSPGTGFLTFFRGNRNNMYTSPGKLNAPFLPAEDVLLTFTGPVNKGNIDVPVGFTNFGHSTDGYYIAGNPYPATIDWHELRNASSNLSSTILIITGGKPNATYNAVGNVSVNGGSRYIQPGQGFYVQALSGGGTLRFRENQKNTVEAPARLLAKPDDVIYTDFAKVKSSGNAQSPAKQLRLSLFNSEFSEEALLVFDDAFTKYVDDYDSKYLEGYNINLATISPRQELLAINSTAPLDTVNLWVNADENSQMTLKFGNLDAFAKQQILLWDKLLNKKIQVSSGDAYTFAIDKSNPASYGADRFSVLFKEIGITPATNASLKIFPNPVKEELTIDLGLHPAVEISIVDMSGRILKMNTFAENQEIKINVSDLNQAIYMLQVRNRDTKEIISHAKFVKN
ncbi:T9SS type A sorting domain-containing protein [Pedobacter glucosidilyticus]|uniref:T9SS type A sorting domain-containing protein n=1 Tax=Pedobacter glucosidilyticus TaxID=1122941 RepID=UPI00047BA744|nr:T9SS type A sorting domain-containing protein [Pedobacter glucosidilyticus]